MGYFNFAILGLFLYISHFSNVEGVCPFILAGTPLQEDVPDIKIPDEATYVAALDTLDVRAVFDDIYDVMANSQECFPADEFNGVSSYAGLFLRLAWHCAGTFRATDGEGGCAGGRQRYLPESNWDDNVQLDKARALLAPIKFKYGDALSWGDLIIFAGNAAILNGDGPVIEVCAGRIDEVDGTNSEVLNVNTTCDDNEENCGPPLGASTVGLIYVNAQGVDGLPFPNISAPRIREIFTRMGMSDLETVALIGGGHAFGKCHGACPLGPGPGPLEQPKNPWPGMCGNNFPQDTWTSGIEGQWTSYPFQWDNQFFQLLYQQILYPDLYQLIIGPGGAYQWNNTQNGLLMLTTDIAFTEDTEYRLIVEKFAEDIQQLDFYFSQAWAKLTTSGGSIASNSFCVDGSDLRPRRDESCQDSRRTPFMRRYPRLCRIFGDYLEDTGICNDICQENEFRFNDEYMCENCQDVFGEFCEECADGIGCLRCESSCKRAINSCGLYYCMPDHY